MLDVGCWMLDDGVPVDRVQIAGDVCVVFRVLCVLM